MTNEVCPVTPYDFAPADYAEQVAAWLADPHAYFKSFGPEARAFQARNRSDRLRVMTLVAPAEELVGFRPVCISLDGVREEVASWEMVFAVVSARLLAARPQTFAALQAAGELAWLGCPFGGAPVADLLAAGLLKPSFPSLPEVVARVQWLFLMCGIRLNEVVVQVDPYTDETWAVRREELRRKRAEQQAFMKGRRAAQLCRGFGLPFSAVVLLTASAAFAGVEARVRTTPGGPRLFIDGKRHLARSLMVECGTTPQYLEADWKAYDMVFTPHVTSKANVHFRFEAKNGPGDAKAPDGWARFRNVRITDEAGRPLLPDGGFSSAADFAKNWFVNAPDTTGRVSFEPDGIVKVDVFKDPDVKRRSDFHLWCRGFEVTRGKRYHLTFEAKADRHQFFNPRVYQSPGFTPVPIAPDPFDEQVRMARDAGVDIIIPNGSGPTWCKDGTFSFEKVDQLFDRILDVHPKAYVMARLSVMGPSWLYEQHPDWLMKYASGRKATMAPPTCRPWLEQAKRSLVALSEHLEAKYPDHFIGLHIGGQCSGEWGYDAWFRDVTSGYDAHTLAAWRAFLAKRGEPDAATAEVPTPEERAAWDADGECLFDPARNARVIAFNEFQQQAMVDCISELAATARQATRGRKVVMFFYGYNFSVAMCGADTGHYGLGRLLDRSSADIDALCGPFTYQDRHHPPDTRPEMSPAETVRRHGVMWWNEDDTRTYRHCTPMPPDKIGAFGAGITKEETIAILERNNLQNARLGSGYWWMDLFGKGWFMDEDLWQVMRKTREAEEKALASDEPYLPDVAVLVSEDSFVRRKPRGGQIGEKLVALGSAALMQSGVKGGQYHLEDVLANDVPARCQIHLASWYLSETSRAALKVQRVCRPDLVRVWCWAPGYLSERSRSDENVRDATGFAVRRVRDKRYPATPLFSPVVEKGDEVWERYEDGSPSVVCRRLAGGGAEVFHGPYALTAETIRRAAALVPAAAPAVELPGEAMTNAPISCAPFPDRMSAYVWRNWFVVPHDRLARVVGATEPELEQVAAEMGLPKKVDVLPEWRRKGYITVLRRNWHLLDYPQLMPLLDMTRQELRFALMEDDFLWVKVGRLKPKCGTLAWNAEEVANGSGARQRIAGILKDEGVDDFTEEPRFQFVKDISQVRPSTSSLQPQPSSSPFDLRLIFSYFADYGDPLGDPKVGSFPEGLLQKLAAQGVNAVWLHTVLNTLAKDQKYPEFGKGCEARMENLRTLVARAAKYGIRVYLYMNEPRAQPPAFFEVNDERRAMKGVTQPGDGTFTMCSSHPATLRWMREAIRSVFAAAPGLGGIFTITMSENHTNCASRRQKAQCPRCSRRTTASIIAEVNRTLIEGMRAANPKAEAIVWNWGWPDDETQAILAALPKEGCRLMAVSERGMKISRGGVSVTTGDYSISCVGPSEASRGFWRAARAQGLPVIAKVQANTTWEISTVPYLPVMDLVAEHASNLVKEDVHSVMLSWSLGCAPAPNLRIYDEIGADGDADKVLDRLAAELYGADAVTAVRKAWTSFSDGFRNYPFAVNVAYAGPQHWGCANPLYWKKTGYGATMVGIPYDQVFGWAWPYPPAVWADLLQKVADGFEKGCMDWRLAIGKMSDPAKRLVAEREAGLFRVAALHFASGVDQYRFVQARDGGDEQGMRTIADRECARAKEELGLVRADSRIGYESSNHYFFIPQDLREKILSCRIVK